MPRKKFSNLQYVSDKPKNKVNTKTGKETGAAKVKQIKGKFNNKAGRGDELPKEKGNPNDKVFKDSVKGSDAFDDKEDPFKPSLFCFGYQLRSTQDTLASQLEMSQAKLREAEADHNMDLETALIKLEEEQQR